MRIQKKTWMAVLLALMLVCWTGLCAHAEEVLPELDITVTADPGNPSVSEEIALSFSLTNHSEEQIDRLLLATPEGQERELSETIAPGETLSFSQIHADTQTELEAGAISYLITCETASGRYSYPAVAALNQLVARPEVEFLRHVSGRSVPEGPVSIVYEVRNTGNVSVQNLSVADALGAFTGQLDRLEVGETHTFVSQVVLTDVAVSTPELTYSPVTAPEDLCTVRLDDLSISIADEALNLILTAGRSMFIEDTAEVVLRLTNVGNTDYSDITVYDELYGGVIADAIVLPAGGEPVDVAWSYPIRENERYCWRVVGTSKAGSRLDQLTNVVTVPAHAAESISSLDLTAAAKMPKISRSGYVPFTLTLNNSGSALLRQVQVWEETLGQLCELTVVPTGEPTVHTERIRVEASTTYHFYAVYTDGEGQTHTTQAEPVEITIAAGGQRPETEDDPQQTLSYSGLSMQFGSSSLFLWLLIASLVILVVLSIVLLFTSHRARKARKERAAARKQRLKEEMGKTNRFKPIRQNSKKQGK